MARPGTEEVGIVAAIKIGTTPPTNLQMLWYDDNVGQKIHKYYDVNTTAWVPVPGAYAGPANFTDLNDTPGAYAIPTNGILMVNAGATALIEIDGRTVYVDLLSSQVIGGEKEFNDKVIVNSGVEGDINGSGYATKVSIVNTSTAADKDVVIDAGDNTFSIGVGTDDRFSALSTGHVELVSNGSSVRFAGTPIASGYPVFNTASITGVKTITFQNLSGTVALLSDLTAQDTLAEILAVGNTTGPNGIIVDDGEIITNAAGTVYLDFNTGEVELRSSTGDGFYVAEGDVGVRANGLDVISVDNVGKVVFQDTYYSYYENAGGFQASLQHDPGTPITADRAYLFPNKSGTLALLDDLAVVGGLPAVLAANNTTGANNILVDSNQQVVFNSNVSGVAITDSNTTAGLTFNDDPGFHNITLFSDINEYGRGTIDVSNGYLILSNLDPTDYGFYWGAENSENAGRNVYRISVVDDGGSRDTFLSNDNRTSFFSTVDEASYGAVLVGQDVTVDAGRLNAIGLGSRSYTVDSNNKVHLEGLRFDSTSKTMVGTASGTIGMTTITGVGTLFGSDLNPGEYITIGGDAYRVDSITSDTSLEILGTLSVGYVGAALSRAPYGLMTDANSGLFFAAMDFDPVDGPGFDVDTAVIIGTNGGSVDRAGASFYNRLGGVDDQLSEVYSFGDDGNFAGCYMGLSADSTAGSINMYTLTTGGVVSHGFLIASGSSGYVRVIDNGAAVRLNVTDDEIEIHANTYAELQGGNQTDYSNGWVFADAAEGSIGFGVGDAEVVCSLNQVQINANGVEIFRANATGLGLFGATPIAQPTTGHAAAVFAANTSGLANDTATFDGYTIGQVVKVLRDLGGLQ